MPPQDFYTPIRKLCQNFICVGTEPGQRAQTGLEAHTVLVFAQANVRRDVGGGGINLMAVTCFMRRRLLIAAVLPLQAVVLGWIGFTQMLLG
ncbi:MAG: hypothetical protein CM15mP120_27710 [Pseudomonadota bacterium]|nr:MAG: hypothetical protein CM15mP120_27710 [Pseudomonadota bacterium]